MSNFAKDFLQTIGSIVVNSVILEGILMRAISKLMLSYTKSDLTMRLIAGDSFEVLLSKYKKLVTYFLDEKGLYKKELKEEIKNLCKELKEINKSRNIVVHSMWFLDGERTLTRAKYKRYIAENPNILDIEIITELDWEIVKQMPSKIRALRGKLLSFNKKIIKFLGK